MTPERFQSIIKTGAQDAPGMAKQSYYELLMLTNSVLEPLYPDRILEIGVANGGTTKLFKELVSEYVVGVDIQKGFSPELEDKKFKFLLGSSHSRDMFERISEHGAYDVVFIDGDHTNSAVLMDTLLYAPMARKAIIWHDIRMLSPSGIKKPWYGYIKEKYGGFDLFLNPNNTGYGVAYVE